MLFLISLSWSDALQFSCPVLLFFDAYSCSSFATSITSFFLFDLYEYCSTACDAVVKALARDGSRENYKEGTIVIWNNESTCAFSNGIMFVFASGMKSIVVTVADVFAIVTVVHCSDGSRCTEDGS